MQQHGNYITGGFVQVNNISKGWVEVSIHTDTFEKDDKFEDYIRATREVKGLFTDLCDGKHACVRFAEPEDATIFKLKFDNLCESY